MKRKFAYYSLLLIVFVSSKIIALANPKEFIGQDSLTVSKSAFNFIVIGDWGRNGDYLQRETAVQLNKTAKELGASFIVSAGDNFLTQGVASVNDPQWWFSFEDVYKGANLQIDWFITLGNHDYMGSVKAQIDYSKISRRWRLPSHYYSFERFIKDTDKKILFIFLDTNQFEKSYYKRPDRYPELINQNPDKQLVWLDSVLTNSKADWKIVIGHHHVYTGGMRKNEKSEAGQVLEPILKKYNIDAYICSHEHDLQYLKPEGKTHYIISGAGSEVRPTGNLPITKFAKSENGFCTFTVSDKDFLIQFVNYKGEVLYKNKISK